jgi:hypothetical protein
MYAGKYNIRALKRDYMVPTPHFCSHQTLIEYPGVQVNTNCDGFLYRGGAHGWLCEQHYSAQTRRRSVAEDGDATTIKFVLATDQKAITRGKVERLNGLKVLL